MSLSVEQLCGLSISPPARVFANNSATSPQRQHTHQPLGREATTAIPSSQTSNAKGKKEKEGYWKLQKKIHQNPSNYQTSEYIKVSSKYSWGFCRFWALPQQHLPLLLNCFCVSVEKTLGLYRSDHPGFFAQKIHCAGTTMACLKIAKFPTETTETTTPFQLRSELGPRFCLGSHGGWNLMLKNSQHG